MNKLRELIAELCPDGVAFMRMGDLVTYEQPSEYIVESIDYKDSE